MLETSISFMGLSQWPSIRFCRGCSSDNRKRIEKKLSSGWEHFHLKKARIIVSILSLIAGRHASPCVTFSDL